MIPAAPDATNLKSPARTALVPVASLVTVFVSVLSTVIVVPVCDTETFVPPTNVRSPEVREPVVPPLSLVIVSVEEISNVGVLVGAGKVP